MANDMLPDESGIYKIVNKINGKFYIGSAVNLRTRKNRHWSELRKQTHYNTHLKRAFTKYGENNFEFIPLFFCKPENLEEWESAAIDYFKPNYNIRLDCTTNRGIKWTEKHENSLKALTGVRTPEQMKRRCLSNILIRLEKNPNTGTKKQGNRYYAASGCYPNRTALGGYATREEARTAYLKFVTETYGE